ncbi:thioredoxin domain-containing protein pretaporter [Lycorma delicatula]|uniref:thioredoxin domain-containing protein pretaporter n=1 Tax=Lycorma delicatula TaxID=130591 RepID=UPI003F518D74
MNYLSCFFLANLFYLVSADEEVIKSKVYHKDNFNDEVIKNNHFVMFYAPWCTYCKRLHPTWEELAEMLNEDDKSQVTIAKVDCTISTELCSLNDITGYPTLLFFHKGKTVGVKFRGTRDLPSLTTFINVQLGSDKEVSEEEDDVLSAEIVQKKVSGLVELTEETFDKHIQTGHHFVKFYAPWCGHCQKLAPIWDLLAKEFESYNTLSIAKVDCTQHRPICQSFEVKSYPTLLWIQDGKKVDSYRGSRTLEDLKEYVESKLSSVIHKEAVFTPPSHVEKPELQSILVKSQKGVPVDLTGPDFNSVIKSGFTFVKFYAPWCGHCKRLAPTWDELAKKKFPNQNVKIAKVDCTLDNNRSLCDEQEVDGFPTLFLYRDGKKLSEYHGSRSLDDLFEFITGHFHDEL